MQNVKQGATDYAIMAPLGTVWLLERGLETLLAWAPRCFILKACLVVKIMKTKKWTVGAHEQCAQYTAQALSLTLSGRLGSETREKNEHAGPTTHLFLRKLSEWA